MNDKLNRQIQNISDRICDLNDRIDATISTSELKKIEKVKKKLIKEKDKLYKKFYLKVKEVENGID